MDRLLDPLFGVGAVDAAFADHARLQGMLDFEAALAKAEARLGLIPQRAVAVIAAACDARRYDLDALGREAAAAGNPAIPMVKALTARVRGADPEAARYVHWGATSQDAMDTGLVLQLRVAVEYLRGDLGRLADGLAGLAETHRRTPLAGRTWLQQALPTTLGRKAAGWLDAVTRQRARLNEILPRLMVVQFGGAAGTLAALGDRGMDVAEALAAELYLGAPALPWHAERDRVVEFGCWCGMTVGTVAKIARDISLMMQTEIGEAFEPAGHGRGGSSTMPHKRNPVAAAIVLSAAHRAPGLVATLVGAMPQEHERGLGGWHAEWTALPDLVRLAAGALNATADTVAGLEVRPDRMRANLDVTDGLLMAEAVMMALADKLGRLAAHERVEAACKQAVAAGRPLRDVLGAEADIAGAVDLDALFDPLGYVGSVDRMIDAALSRHHESQRI